MTEVAVAPAAPAATPAEPAQNQGRPTFNHPAIPPLRGNAQSRQQAQEQTPDPAVAAPDVEAQAAPAEPQAEPEADGPDEEFFEYQPDDEFQVTVNGKEQTVTLGKLLASYQRNEASNQRFAEAKQMVANARSAVQTMLTPQGFADVARKMGKDPLAIAEEIVLEHYEYERLSPQERQMRDFQREKSTWEQQQAAERERQQAQQREQAAEQFKARFLDASTQTMDRLRVPADPGLRSELIARAAGIYRSDVASGYDTSPQAAMQDAWNDYQERLQAHARALPLDARLTAEERAKVTSQQAQERVRVAQQVPRTQVAPPRDDSGKFVPKPKPKMDMFAPPMPGRR